MSIKNKKEFKRREKIAEVIRKAGRMPNLSEEMMDRIDRWLVDNSGDDDHLKALEEIYSSLPVIAAEPSRDAKESLAKVKQRLGMATLRKGARTPLYKRTYFRIASAAAVVLIAAGVTFAALWNNDATLPATAVTAAVTDKTAPATDTKTDTTTARLTVTAVEGVNKEITLADNTRVWVNEKSTVTYPESFGEERNVTLAGHGRFDVAPDAGHPFLVHTEHLLVKVLGTDFHVREYADGGYTEVVLYRGAVEVAAGGRAETLRPGERLTYDHVSHEMEIEEIATETIADWRTDAIRTSHKTVPELLRMIANYYDLKIEYDAAAFKTDAKYSLTFGRNDTPENVLKALSEVSGEFGSATAGDDGGYTIK